MGSVPGFDGYTIGCKLANVADTNLGTSERLVQEAGVHTEIVFY